MTSEAVAITDAPVETTEAPKQTSDLQNAMEVFEESIPRIKALTATMDRNMLSRVFNAVASYPFTDKMVLTKNRMEQELFVITIATLAAKNLLMATVNKQELEKQVVDETVNDIISTKEETNERSK